jgi:hypothetical protein
MKLFTGWVISAALVVATTAANAQGPVPPRETGVSPYISASDLGGPYAAMPPDVVPPGPGYGPTLLPVQEVYTVVRENGFLPLGVPRQRGMFYSIAVTNGRGDHGRLVIDARNGQAVRFMPAHQMGGYFREDDASGYGATGPLPSAGSLRSPPRPPVSVPKVASHTPAVPMPKASPRTGNQIPLAEKPAVAPAQQSAAVQARPADTTATPQPVVEAKPTPPQIAPTQDMPVMQGLD